MKKTLAISALMFAIFSGIALWHGSSADANISLITVKSWADVQGDTSPYAIASSSATYVVSTAATSTSFVALVDQADQADLNMLVVASSSAAVLNFQLDFSDDNNCVSSPGSCIWYTEDVNSTSGSTVTHASTTVNAWPIGSTATSTKNVTIGSLGARYMRVDFASAGANLTLWAQIARKSQVPKN